jgi:DnaA family protein
MQLLFPFPVDRDDRFETFAVDDKNRSAVAICQGFAQGTTAGAVKSLTIVGPSGVGKTHLLGAIGKVVAPQGGGMYLDSRDLAEKIVAAESYEVLKEDLARYESAGYLAVDHLDAIADNLEAQDQVFHLYNAVKESGGRFAAALVDPPATWRFADYLATRLAWGVTVSLVRPDEETLAQALMKMGRDRGMILPDAAAKWMVTRLPRDPASLAKALQVVDRYSLTAGRKVSIQLVKAALE